MVARKSFNAKFNAKIFRSDVVVLLDIGSLKSLHIIFLSIWMHAGEMKTKLYVMKFTKFCTFWPLMVSIFTNC